MATSDMSDAARAASMADASDLAALYHWDYRPRLPQRPPWFTSWPGGARMAVVLIILNEWESVPRPIRPMPTGSHHTFDFLSLGAREYGARFGLHRLLEVLERRSLKATVISSGLVAELFPETIREAQAHGHELATHQWDQAVHPPVFRSKEEERDSLLKAIASLERVTGERPIGYMSQGPRPTAHTLDLCAELGFRWTCDYSDSDVPYVIDVKGTPIVSIGYVMPACVDNDLVPLGLNNGLLQLKDEFEAAYRESQRWPMKLCYTVHTHVSGRPGMAALLEQFLDFAGTHEGVWFPRCIDIADFWLEGTSRPTA